MDAKVDGLQMSLEEKERVGKEKASCSRGLLIAERLLKTSCDIGLIPARK